MDLKIIQSLLERVQYAEDAGNVQVNIINHGSPRERDAASENGRGTPSAIPSSESYV